MKNIIVFAGSNSSHSINKQLAGYASEQLKVSTPKVLDLNDYPLPVFSVDLESEHGFPDAAIAFNDELDQCDGIILSLAEHNGSYTVAFKNLFDWLSRIDKNTWKGKPMLLLSASPGGRGGKSVLDAAKSRFPLHDVQIVETFSLPYFSDNFAAGRIVNESLKDDLKKAVEKFERVIKVE
jgi:chromate reductase